MRLTKSSVGGYSMLRVCRAVVQAMIPSSWGIFVYNDLTSKVMSNTFVGRDVRVFSLFRK